nr:immunoglobulin light chain junction region [Macaca mulatta]MOX80410.1 immunoglobulin light chain junction region [Macaca mulatta]MOX80535.1 immunoglobulin light chain junction region [Macaca mulatta]MOX81494.1 immunoglobulin light chain junction region [Macaca mulatta]MOX83303.1 immunoglobulin light chain junction region [Macaca mulatta]
DYYCAIWHGSAYALF